MLIISQTTNFRPFQTERFADDNFKFDQNGRKLQIWLENTAEKKEKLLLQAISPFPEVFSKDLYCRHVKNTACFPNDKILTLQN